MDSIADDPRFSHIATDPRFRSMPKTKRKVKIDKRFSSIFSAKHFQTRTDIDKRGRPVHDVSKRNKHVMERFYELSSDDSDESDSNDQGKEIDDVDLDDNKTLHGDRPSVKSKGLKQKRKADSTQNFEISLNTKKRKLSQLDSAESTSKLKSKSKKAKLTPEDKEMEEDNQTSLPDEDASENDASELSEEDEDSSGEDEDSSDEDKDSSDEEGLPEYTADFDLDETGVEHKWNELQSDALEVSESTHRLAVCNMDWDFVKAQDLFVLLKSFVPEGGRVKSVTIYPSQYGKERMAEEALLGPKEMRDMTNSVSGNDNESNNTDNKDREERLNGNKKKRKRKKEPVNQQQLKRQDNDIVKHETEKLREYQLNRLRYYYAVVDCDSVASADAIYHECDGKEYQLSSVRLDLRYIPDDMTFDDEPKETFSEEQGLMDYAPNKFLSTALSQAKVEVTWDETDFDRLSKRMAGLQRKELESIVEENQYADIIAPPESDSEAEDDRPNWLKQVLAEEDSDEDDNITEERKIELYRKVLIDKQTEEKEADNDDVDKEIQWTPGLKSSAQEKLKKKKKEKEMKSDLVEGYLEKKKEKKRKKLEKKKKEMTPATEGDDNLAFSDDDIPEDIDDDLRQLMESEGVAVPKTKSKKGKAKKKSQAKEEPSNNSEDEREKAELELLMMDNDAISVSKPKTVEDGGKMSKKKKKKLAKLAKEKKAKEKQDYDLDLNDERFGALYTSHHFHIDPNAPQFKKTQNMMRLVNEQISRKKKPKTKGLTGNSSEDPVVQDDSKSVSRQLVESLKRKMKK